MPVSSKSIIHYTAQIESLTGIIMSSGFRLKYCRERIILSEEKRQEFNAAFPMVSFCDLPLTHAKEHINSYGAYGIGLSKNWARRNNLNPVLYLEYDSVVSNFLYNEGVRVYGIHSTSESDNEFLRELDKFTELVGFCKNHEGPLVRKDEVINPNYVFYNEREWRYLPTKSLLGELPLSLGTRKYANKDEWNSKIGDIYLKFNYDDISYIIVKSENDISQIVKCLRDRYEADGISAIKLNSLYTKILTSEQIMNDF